MPFEQSTPQPTGIHVELILAERSARCAPEISGAVQASNADVVAFEWFDPDPRHSDVETIRAEELTEIMAIHRSRDDVYQGNDYDGRTAVLLDGAGIQAAVFNTYTPDARLQYSILDRFLKEQQKDLVSLREDPRRFGEGCLRAMADVARLTNDILVEKVQDLTSRPENQGKRIAVVTGMASVAIQHTIETQKNVATIGMRVIPVEGYMPAHEESEAGIDLLPYSLLAVTRLVAEPTITLDDDLRDRVTLVELLSLHHSSLSDDLFLREGRAETIVKRLTDEQVKTAWQELGPVFTTRFVRGRAKKVQGILAQVKTESDKK